ncbi:MAG TPA: hypothetical protein VJ464_26030 [Blastocatellia bacterium]|nr:hypothetical protein [Blastocatellia bacterium]
MIDVKEAVDIALDYLGKLYDMSTLQDILLEEVVLSDDEKFWYVTIGFSRLIYSTDPMGKLSETIWKISGSGAGPQKYQREYKVFQIDSATGQVKSMKMRAA